MFREVRSTKKFIWSKLSIDLLRSYLSLKIIFHTVSSWTLSLINIDERSPAKSFKWAIKTPLCLLSYLVITVSVCFRIISLTFPFVSSVYILKMMWKRINKILVKSKPMIYLISVQWFLYFLILCKFANMIFMPLLRYNKKKKWAKQVQDLILTTNRIHVVRITKIKSYTFIYLSSVTMDN